MNVTPRLVIKYNRNNLWHNCLHVYQSKKDKYRTSVTKYITYDKVMLARRVSWHSSCHPKSDEEGRVTTLLVYKLCLPTLFSSLFQAVTWSYFAASEH